ncbi:MAG: PP2C family protein-serine/threonine phosphatase [Chloroflexaceae bacterium]|nr:PP2C family protein-serine/threonine phosphatase [Chloroflexaceae bacterium]
MIEHDDTREQSINTNGHRQSHSSLVGHRVRSRRRAVLAAPEPVTPPVPGAPGTPSTPSRDEQRQAELEQELQLARDIQQGILLAAVPYLPGWEMSTVSVPARDLGGDLYDFVPLPDGKQGIMIGDVSGKGLPAALRMAVARTVFRHEARKGDSPGRTLEAVNRIICSDIPQGMVTMIYIQLDPLRGTIRFANAGHTYPFVLNDTVGELELSGLPLGIFEESDYEEVELLVEPGTSMLLYTDGVTEATNEAEEMFGAASLPALLEANRLMKPSTLQRMLLRELRTWNPQTIQDDDVTMVVIRRRYLHIYDELYNIAVDVLGTERAANFWQQHVAGHAVLREVGALAEIWADHLPELTAMVHEQFGRGLARELQQQMRLALEEYRQ